MATTRVMRTVSIHKQMGKEGITRNLVGEESSQTYKAGAPLVMDASNKDVEIWAGGTDATKLIGFAAAPATGTTGAVVSFYEANDSNLFEGSLINATTAYVLLGTELGVKYSLVASGDDWYVDVADTTTTKVEVVGLIDAVGDTNPRVVFRVLTDLQSLVGAA